MTPLSHNERVKAFGEFEFRPAPTARSAEHIKINPAWVRRRIVKAHCPQLWRLFRIARVNVHAAAAESFLALWADWEREGLLGAVTTWNGSWVPRFKRGRAPAPGKPVRHRDLSSHSWGTAFDICAREYPMGRPVPEDAPIRALVPLANAHGWAWGGDWRTPDGMHFEFTGEDPILAQPMGVDWTGAELPTAAPLSEDTAAVVDEVINDPGK